jgi:hypothetical protein
VVVIYNYLCNQFLSPLMLSVRIPFMARYTRYNIILFKIIVQHIRFVKGRETCGSGERNVKIWIDFRKSPRFSLTLPLSQEKEKLSRPVFTGLVSPVLHTPFLNGKNEAALYRQWFAILYTPFLNGKNEAALYRQWFAILYTPFLNGKNEAALYRQWFVT